MKHTRCPKAFAVLAVAWPVLAGAAGDAHERGQAIYRKWCLPCHGVSVKSDFPGTVDGVYAGTQALAVKYKGQVPPVLTERTNLSPELLRAIVRNGIYSMPRTRKTEIGDTELDDLAAYLVRPARADAAR